MMTGNCVGESKEWEANKKFDVLFINPVKVGVDFIGIIFYKQLADGKDGDFLYEFQQQIGTENRKYATVNSGFYLPVGTTRSTLCRGVNVTQCLRKAT
jgi:hypothetical protein